MKLLLILKNKIFFLNSFFSLYEDFSPTPTLRNDRSKWVWGFTLIEIIITMAIITTIGGLCLSYGLDNLRYHYLYSDRDTLISSLQFARGKAMANTCEKSCSSGQPYGVYLENDKFIIFEGQTYSSTFNDNNIILSSDPSIIHSGINEIYFDQLSGNAHSNQIPPWEIILNNTLTGQNSTITINNEGQISWTN